MKQQIYQSNQQCKSFRFSVSFRVISRLDSALIFLRWFK